MPASDWSDLCASTIVWRRLQGRDTYGKPTGYDAPVLFSPPTGGREYVGKVRIRNAEGVIQYIDGSTIWILATPDIQMGDQVYVEGTTGPYPPIISIDQPRDETGAKHHTKIVFGRYNG